MKKKSFSTEYLNTLTPSGMPPHVLELKKGSIIMLLRNINMKIGLCNGTRMIVHQIYDNFLDVEIISGSCIRLNKF